jgi:hypothetical protein
MKKLYVTLMIAFVCTMADAQISLTASMAPPVNSMFIYYDANVPVPAFTFSTSGINNTWDFSALTPAVGADDTVFFADPANYPLSIAFPTATFATWEGGDDNITMVTVNPNYSSFLGLIGDPLGSGTLRPLLANPPAVSMTFPYTYGSTSQATTEIHIWTTGAAIGQPLADSVHYKSTMMFDGSVVAAGDLVLPSGTYQSLLEHRVSSNIDSAWIKVAGAWGTAPGTPTSGTDSSYYWYTDQSLQHYAHLLYKNGTIDDVHYYMSTLSTGINTVDHNKNIVAYPNPAHDFLGIKGLNTPEASEWKVFDLNGKKVMEGKSNLNSLDIKKVACGTYVLRITMSDGQSREIKFMKK